MESLKEISRGNGKKADELEEMVVKNEYLEVRDLKVEYTAAGEIVHAVNGISFSMKKGETLALVGETGAGKTTIAKAILRILPNPQAKIKSGEIILNGEDILKKSEEEMLNVRGKKIAMIFQDPMTALNPLITVGDQITEGLLLHNDYSKAEAKAEAKKMMEMVGILSSRYDEYPFEFSGGMKQRIVIAMALACNPELVLADEPTTALDVTIQAQVLDLISQLKKQRNTSMILITHDLGVVAQNCDNVAVIYAGKIIEYGSKRAVFQHPTHPYTIGLFASLPSANRHEKRLRPIRGLTPDPTNLPNGCAFHPRCPYATAECREKEPPYLEVAAGHFSRCCNKTQEG